MKNIFRKAYLNINHIITERTAKIIFLLPVLLFILLTVLILIPFSRDFGFWLLKENRPVELLTFFFFLFGGVYGFSRVFMHSKHIGIFPTVFYGVFCFFLIIVAMEEIAWGQWFFNFKTPTEWMAINVQGETTLHNISEMQEENDVLRLVYGLGGLTGIMLGYFNKFKHINVPLILVTWFVIIVFHAFLDIYVDQFKHTQHRIIRPIIRLNELTELIVSISAFLYLWLNFRLIKKLSKISP